MKQKAIALPYVAWKYFPKWFCRLVNRLFGRPVIARSKLYAKWSVEQEKEIREYHGLDVENEIRTALTKELNESLKKD